MHRLIHKLLGLTKNTPDLPATPALRTRLHALEATVADLEHDLRILSGKHAKLAGSYYARFGATSPETATLTKDQLRMKLGLRPGRPVPILNNN